MVNNDGIRRARNGSHGWPKRRTNGCESGCGCDWAERKVDVARALGYRDGGSVLQVIKRLEAARRRDPALDKRLADLEKLR